MNPKQVFYWKDMFYLNVYIEVSFEMFSSEMGLEAFLSQRTCVVSFGCKVLKLHATVAFKPRSC